MRKQTYRSYQIRDDLDFSYFSIYLINYEQMLT